MNNAQKIEAHITANYLIGKAKDWLRLGDQSVAKHSVKNKLVLVDKESLDKTYEVANEIKSAIARMDDETKAYVFDEIDNINNRARAEIKELGDYDASGNLEHILEAIKSLYTFKGMVEDTVEDEKTDEDNLPR